MSLPETLTMSFSSSGLRLSFAMGGGGSGLFAMGTHPMAAARAKGNQAATDAILPPLATLESPLWGAILVAYKPSRPGAFSFSCPATNFVRLFPRIPAGGPALELESHAATIRPSAWQSAVFFSSRAGLVVVVVVGHDLPSSSRSVCGRLFTCLFLFLHSRLWRTIGLVSSHPISVSCPVFFKWWPVIDCPSLAGMNFQIDDRLCLCPFFWSSCLEHCIKIRSNKKTSIVIVIVMRISINFSFCVHAHQHFPSQSAG